MVFNQYAQFYDLIYKRKNYKRECDFLEEIFQQYGPRLPRTILDLGCGTGNHMLPFLRRGYEVTGVDQSPQMIKIAERKFRHLKKAKLIQDHLESFVLNKKFDVLICVFSVINYLVDEKKILQFLRNAREHMTKRSLFIFDFWNKEAVERYYVPEKRNVFFLGEKILERSSKTKLMSHEQLCEVHYTCALKDNGRFLKRIQEKHLLRYFSIEQMGDLLDRAGLKVVGQHPFLNLNGKIRKNTWDITIVAKQIDRR